MELTKSNYVDEAEAVVKKLERDKWDNMKLTTSKIRNILSMVSGIYNDVIHLSEDTLPEEIMERIQYLKMRLAYEAGREREGAVRDLVNKGHIREVLEDIGDSKERCIVFCRYMESIVAFHKYYGGRD